MRGYINRMEKTIIKPQPTEENPCIVENYPYGFKRTQIRYWVESVKKRGDRFVSQTLNPKTNQWNKPKKSTYSAVIVAYIDEKGHTKGYYYHKSTDEESYKKLVDFIGDLELNELQKEELRVLRAYIKTYRNVTFEVKPYEETTNEEHEKEQKEIEESIKKNVAYNYHTDEGGLK